MNNSLSSRQRGLGFPGFILGAFLLVFASIVGLSVIPAYMQNAQIGNLFTAIAGDPEMQKASPRDIRMSFTKRASIDSITAIKADDVEITNESGRLVLRASYSVRLPLVSNISLCLDFNPTSAK